MIKRNIKKAVVIATAEVNNLKASCSLCVQHAFSTTALWLAFEKTDPFFCLPHKSTATAKVNLFIYT